MATIKSFTSLEQSKKLAKILPIETADMWYSYYGDPKYNSTIAYEGEQWFLCQLRNSSHDIPCWSLAALLSVIPEPKLIKTSIERWELRCWNEDRYFWTSDVHVDPIEACVEMITKLHELKKK
jgi:hypothetical protein